MGDHLGSPGVVDSFLLFFSKTKVYDSHVLCHIGAKNAVAKVIFFFFLISGFFFVGILRLIQKKSKLSLKNKKISFHIDWVFFGGEFGPKNFPKR